MSHRAASLVLGVAWVCVFGAAACGGADEAIGEPDPGRSGGECADYKDSFCDWFARCEPSTTRARCEEGTSAIGCREGDAEPLRCTAALDGSSCARAPSGCNLYEIADPAPAIEACGAFVEAACAALLRCGASQPLAECVEQARAVASCDRIYGVLAGYQQCLEELPLADCAQIPPPSCNGILQSLDAG